jgi:hypothetical protein
VTNTCSFNLCLSDSYTQVYCRSETFYLCSLDIALRCNFHLQIMKNARNMDKYLLISKDTV